MPILPALLAGLVAAPLLALPIESGLITTPDAGGTPDLGYWNIVLTAPGFDLQFRLDGLTFGGCRDMGGGTLCPGLIAPYGSAGVQIGAPGSGTVDGTTYPQLVFLPGTAIHLTAQSIMIPGPGPYEGPFTLTGHIVSAFGVYPGTVILDTDISGAGTLYLFAMPLVPGSPQSGVYVRSMSWQLTPEPSGATLAALGLLAGAVASITRRARRARQSARRSNSCPLR